MLKKVISGLLALGLFAFLLLGAENPFVGTWKLNVAKSKFYKGHEAKEMTLVVAVEGDVTTVSLNGTVGEGQALAFKYNVPTAGGPINYTEGAPPAGTSDSLKKIDDRTVELTSTMNGKLVFKQHIVVSPNHKPMTIRESGVDEKGMPVRGLHVYDRQ
jgi:hypothetical protein